MGQRQVMVFANPIAGRGKGRRVGEALREKLVGRGFGVELIFDRIEGFDVGRLPREVWAAVVIGGDGTLRAVATKLAGESAVGGAKSAVGSGQSAVKRGGGIPPLLVVPMGTANLMGRYLGIRKGDRDLVERLVAAVERRAVTELDAGRANGVPFLLVAGAGLDGAIVHELDKRRSGPIGMLSYAVPTALTLLNYRYPKMTVEVDGEVVMGGEPGIVMVGNIPEYGTGFPMLPLARPDDGLLDVLAVRVGNQMEALEVFMHAVAGEHLGVENTTYLRGKKIRVTSSEPVAVQADGEAAGFTPLEVDLLPVRVPFIVP